MQTPRKVVVTGAALSSPLGNSLLENTTAWWEGRTNFQVIRGFNTDGCSIKHAGQCADPDTRLLPDRKVTKILRRKDVISLLTTLAAAQDAKLATGAYNPERCGMYVGAASTQIGDLTPYFSLVSKCADLEAGTFDSASFGDDMHALVNPLVVLQLLMNNALCFGTMTLDIRGVNANFMDFQVAGLRAVGEAFRSIQTGRADVCFAGGVASPVEPFQLVEGVRAGILASTDKYAEALPPDLIKPYDLARQGALLSEGSAFLVLEAEEHARARGAEILAEVSGFALASDAHIAFTDDYQVSAKNDNNVAASRGLEGAVQRCLASAGIEKPAAIIGHGHGARLADAVEARTYLELGFGDVPVMSPQSVLGSMGEASGVAALVVAIDALKRSKIPPTFNYRAGDYHSSQLSLAGEAQSLRGKGAVAVTMRSVLGLAACMTLHA